MEVAISKGVAFHGISGEYIGNNSKIILGCIRHGKWETATIAAFLSKCDKRKSGCPTCQSEIVSSLKKHSIEQWSAKFMAAGEFEAGTTFERSERISVQKNGINKRHEFWIVECGKCKYKYESRAAALKAGIIACKCKKQKQKECYINAVSDFGTVIALKFGVAIDSGSRIKQQKRSCKLDVENMVVYRFESHRACMDAEIMVSKSMECGVISRSDMPDGYTETTYVRNYDRICEIFSESGGLKV